MAGKSSEGSIKWQLCYDISARTWWMVSWHELLSSFFFSFSFPPAKHPRSPLLLSLLLSAPPAVSELLSIQKRKLVKARIKWLRVRVRALLPVLTERTLPPPPSLPVMSRDELGSGPGRLLRDDAKGSVDPPWSRGASVAPGPEAPAAPAPPA